MAYEDIIEVETAKERFMGNNKMFLNFLYQFPERSLYSKLEKEIESGNIKEAFDIAHTMKGIASNLSLKSLDKPMYDVVETLRKGEIPDDKEWSTLKEAYDDTVDKIKKIKEENITFF